MEPIVKMEGISKRFSGVVALDNISFEVMPGEVHVLLGENGAGKSTLMKILSGAYFPDQGQITVQGKEYTKLTPKISAECGISIIYQELSVIDDLSIQENIFMGRMPKRSLAGIKIIDKEAMAKRTGELLQSIHLGKSPATQVGSLNISEKQMVEIAKAVAFNANVIVMDEPTSSLTDEEVNRLFTIIEKLKAEGKGIIFISHKMKEIMKIGDRVTVLKDGTYVGTKNIKDITVDQLVTMMVGRELQDKYLGNAVSREHGDVMFEVKGLTRKDRFVEDISFALHRGEILGFSGLIGAGRSETMSAIYGAAPIRSGEVWLNGTKLKIKTPYDALKAGIGLVTENRRETGFFKNFSIRKNIAIAHQLQTTALGGLWGFVNHKQEKQIAEEQCQALRVKAASIEQNITQLSGGNQQKVIIGKWMAAGIKLLILDEPTKGIDVGTKSEIYKLVRALAESGIGVIVVSSELPELLSVCDRIVVMNSGQIAAEYTSEEATEEKLVKAATMDLVRCLN